ncbi:hypothetical protein CBS101457_006698 [Exobasidium rhododendri]|nr:hypothetical protein CBS101457_006698 [Exobasidium rhododendri]
MAASQNLTLVGASCNPNNTRLLVDNNQLRSDCGYLAWCDATDDTCKVRGCRRSEWPFGFNKVSRHLWPPLCPSDQFCPDEESLCMPKGALGAPCQLNRDDECLQSTSSQGAICLHNECVAVNATLGGSCTFENTLYTDYVNTHTNYGGIISRDNCVAGLYCDAPTTQCKERLAKGSSCSSDKECQSGYCADNNYIYSIPVNNNMTGSCGEDIGANPSRAYVYVLVLLFTFAMVIATGLVLVKVHQKQTKAKKLARVEYWQGQRLISEKAKLIDGSIRAGTPSLLSSSSRLQQYQSGSVSRTESKIQNLNRYSDGSSAGFTSLTGRVGGGSTTPSHPLQQNINYSSLRQEEGNTSDNAYARPHSPSSRAVLAPSPSIHTLQDTYLPNGVAGSSAVDPFTSTQNESHDSTMRNRDINHRAGDGWQSPDTRLRASLEGFEGKANKATPSNGSPF